VSFYFLFWVVYVFRCSLQRLASSIALVYLGNWCFISGLYSNDAVFSTGPFVALPLSACTYITRGRPLHTSFVFHLHWFIKVGIYCKGKSVREVYYTVYTFIMMCLIGRNVDWSVCYSHGCVCGYWLIVCARASAQSILCSTFVQACIFVCIYKEYPVVHNCNPIG
jgi:hypothetical protein